MISGKTTLFGIIGHPISHSFSPAMHNAAFAERGIDAIYVPFPIAPDEIEVGLRGLKSAGVRGVNVTLPHKQAVIPLLDEVGEAAVVIGAVNTIDFSNGSTRGYNTDWSGFLTDLERYNVDIAGRDCLVLGAGGSARAIVYGLLKGGARVHLLARRVVQAQALKDDFSRHIDVTNLHTWTLNDLADVPAVAPLIINTTPLGMWPNVDVSAWPNGTPVPAGSFVYDLVYNPATTQLMKQGKAARCKTANGLGMLLYQGVHAFERWTGEQPDLAVMQAALIATNHDTLDI